MGKIRVSTLGEEDEKAKKEKARIKREQKELRKTHMSGMKGGEKLVDMSGPVVETPAVPTEPVSTEPTESAKSAKPTKEHTRSKIYQQMKKLVDHDKLYSLSDALDLVKKTSFSKFDGSVEVHINCLEKGLRGQVNLPHGIGKEVRVAIADDELIDKVSSGKIDFDVLVATPQMMPKLAKVAKILGPRGLMPNPKAGTISDKPQDLVKKLSTGQTQYKTESEFPIIHMVIGKVSFPNKDLEDNFGALTDAIGKIKIKGITLKATMGPGIKVEL